MQYIRITVTKTIVDTFDIPVNGHYDHTDGNESMEYAEFHNLADYSEPETIDEPEITVSEPFGK